MSFFSLAKEWRIITVTVLVIFIFPNFVNAWTEDFDDGDDEGWTKISGGWMVDNGRYKQFIVNDSDKVYCAIFNSDWKIDDGTVEAKISFSPTASNINTGVILYRMKDEKNGYASGLDRKKGSVTIAKVIDGKYEVIESANKPLTDDTWYTIKVHLDGDSISALVDEREYLSINDNTFKVGKIGVGVVKTRSPIYFDEIKVSISKPVRPKVLLASTWAKIKGNY